MSISLDDDLIAIADVPADLQKRTGKRPHIASIYRWMTAGLQGVKLQTICIGGSRYTSREALNTFCARVTAAKQAGHSEAFNAGSKRAKIARENQLEREAKELGI